VAVHETTETSLERPLSSLPLRGRTVVVTGGNRGIGLGIARGVARAGAAVAVWARDERTSARAVAELESTGARALAVECDVGDERQVVEAFKHTVAQFGRVDAVFANAGITAPATSFLDLTLDDWRAVQRINLEGVVLTLREAARHMVERGGGGSLIGVASIAALGGMPKRPHYAASKAGVVSLMKSLAIELGRYGIRSNALLPGWIETDMTADSGSRVSDHVEARTPVHRWGTPDDFDAAAAFLADPRAAFHTGDTLVIDGGYSLL
jgi:NAD(P)-dependent dehydrogenase (short-subunit alcohol dehydrogenase family)